VDPNERKAFLDGLTADFAALRTDPVAWREFQAEAGPW
jgi:hypothetical protein